MQLTHPSSGLACGAEGARTLGLLDQQSIDDGATHATCARLVALTGQREGLLGGVKIRLDPSGGRTLIAAAVAEDDWRRVVDVNLTGTILCQREAFRGMGAQHPQGGRIIDNGSISAIVPHPNSAPYTVTKHAISGLTRSGALDGRALGIAVGQIDIGNAEMNRTLRFRDGVRQADGRTTAEPLMTVMATDMPYVGRG